MGLSNRKPTLKSKSYLTGKETVTTDSSLDLTFVTNNILGPGVPLLSMLKNLSNENISSCGQDKMMTSVDISKLYTEMPIATYTDKEITFKNETQQSMECNIHSKTNSTSRQIERPGLYPVQLNQDNSSFNGVIYLPESPIVLAHYMNLYRLKLDNLCQYDFKSWCLTMGHNNTASRYSQLRKVYNEAKMQHFKDSYIINKILSKKNVDLQISDRFGDEKKPLRALMIVGKRRSLVQSVLDSYCFDIKGKVPFIIKSIEDFMKFVNSCKSNYVFPIKPKEPEVFNFKSIAKAPRSRLSIKSNNLPLALNESPPFIMEDANIKIKSINILRTENGDFNTGDHSQCELLYEPFTNYLRYQRYHADVSNVCYNSPILFGNNSYSLVSIIADKSHAYILCKNSSTDFNYCNETDIKSLMLDELSPVKDANQSNRLSHFQKLQRIMKTEIYETFSQKYYGVSLKQVPCGQFYVVQCTIEGRISDREKLVNKILVRHMVCGKVISREYNLELLGRGDLNFVLHLHGNERHIRKCSNELKNEGLAHNFKLVHPRSGKLFQEKIRALSPDIEHQRFSD